MNAPHQQWAFRYFSWKNGDCLQLDSPRYPISWGNVGGLPWFAHKKNPYTTGDTLRSSNRTMVWFHDFLIKPATFDSGRVSKLAT